MSEFSPDELKADPILQFFSYDHLPPTLRHVSQTVCYCARNIIRTVPRNAERTVALRKLLEAKDAAVRAALYQSTPHAVPGEPVEIGGQDIAEPVEIGGHDIDRDGPVPFSG